MSFVATEYHRNIFAHIDNPTAGSLIVEAVAGCIDGETMIRFNRAGKGFEVSIEKAFKRFHGIDSHPQNNWDPRIQTFVRSYVGDKKISLHPIQDIKQSGSKEVFKVKLENGLSIIATADHKIMTASGWSRVDQLTSSSRVMCDDLRAKKSGKPPKRIRDEVVRGLKYHKYGATDARGKAKRISIHTAIYESYINKLPLNEYIRILKTDREKSRKLRFVAKGLEIHHIDGNHFNNEISNLRVMNRNDHKKLHAANHTKNFNQGIPTFSKFVSRKRVGVRMTYDIVCHDPHRNFVANGIVIHNSGKTTTMMKMLERLPEDAKILLCAFNKSIANELEERAPHHVAVRTMNGLGHRAWSRHIASQAQLNAGKVIDILKSDEFFERCHVDEQRLLQLRSKVSRLVSIAKQSGLVPEGVRDTIGLVPDTTATWDALIDHYDIDFLPEEDRRGMLEAEIQGYINADKADAIELARLCLRMNLEMWNEIDFDDQLYMTVVYNAKMVLYDWVFVDEAQDISPIQRILIKRSLKKTGRLVAVGDPHQCHPAGTVITGPNGAKTKIEKLKAGDPVVGWNRQGQSFHGLTAQSPRVKVASRHYSGPMLHVRADGKEVQCTPNHKWTVKLRKETNLWGVYLMEKSGTFRIGWCQVFNRGGGFHLGQRTRLERADRAWIIGVYESKQEASLQESMLAAEYGIPTVQFRQTISVPTIYTQDALNSFWRQAKGLNLKEKAERILADHGKSIRFPLYKNRRMGKQIKTTVMEVQACNIIPHIMMVPTQSKEKRNSTWATVDEIEERPFEGTVYSLEVPTHGHYIANGLVTHNSIYGFRGADSEALANIAKDFNCKRLPLSISYRCSKAVVAEAQKFVGHILPAPTAPDGLVVDMGYYTPGNMKMFTPGDFVVCRNTAPLVRLCFDLIKAKVRARIAGRDMAEQLVYVIEKMKAKNWSQLSMKLEKWKTSEIKRLLKKDPDANLSHVEERYECIVVFMRNATSDSIPQLIESIYDLFSDEEDETAVTLSTIHKAKGLEADNVILLDRWLLPSKYAKKDWQKEQENNLSYVAITRAKHKLSYLRSPRKEERGRSHDSVMNSIMPDRVERFGSGETVFQAGTIVAMDDGKGNSWEIGDEE